MARTAVLVWDPCPLGLSETWSVAHMIMKQCPQSISSKAPLSEGPTEKEPRITLHEPRSILRIVRRMHIGFLQSSNDIMAPARALVLSWVV